jgi:hypothetical protein
LKEAVRPYFKTPHIAAFGWRDRKTKEHLSQERSWIIFKQDSRGHYHYTNLLSMNFETKESCIIEITL